MGRREVVLQEGTVHRRRRTRNENSVDMLRVDRTMSVRANKQSKRAMSGRRVAERKIGRDDEGKIH